VADVEASQAKSCRSASCRVGAVIKKELTEETEEEYETKSQIQNLADYWREQRLRPPDD
jgi:hypothetical protein